MRRTEELKARISNRVNQFRKNETKLKPGEYFTGERNFITGDRSHVGILMRVVSVEGPFIIAKRRGFRAGFMLDIVDTNAEVLRPLTTDFVEQLKALEGWEQESSDSD